jgi:hypothetical protein
MRATEPFNPSNIFNQHTFYLFTLFRSKAGRLHVDTSSGSCLSTIRLFYSSHTLYTNEQRKAMHCWSCVSWHITLYIRIWNLPDFSFGLRREGSGLANMDLFSWRWDWLTGLRRWSCFYFIVIFSIPRLVERLHFLRG